MKWEPIKNPNNVGFNRDEIILVYGRTFPEDVNSIESFITSGEKEEFRKSGNRMNANIRMACRAVLRMLICQHLRLPPTEVMFQRTVSGKPFLDNAELFFNVSHTDSAFIIAISASGQIGIDMESPDFTGNWQDIMAYAFSEGEKAEIKSGAVFLHIWTRKEAFLKSTGTGLVDFLPAIDTSCLHQESGISLLTFNCPGKEIASLVTFTGQIIIKAFCIN